MQVFRGANVKLRKLATSHCIHVKYVHQSVENRVKVRRTHTESVQSPLVVLVKVRKGGDFFYGKSSNENYSESL